MSINLHTRKLHTKYYFAWRLICITKKNNVHLHRKNLLKIQLFPLEKFCLVLYSNNTTCIFNFHALEMNIQLAAFITFTLDQGLNSSFLPSCRLNNGKDWQPQPCLADLDKETLNLTSRVSLSQHILSSQGHDHDIISPLYR